MIQAMRRRGREVRRVMGIVQGHGIWRGGELAGEGWRRVVYKSMEFQVSFES